MSATTAVHFMLVRTRGGIPTVVGSLEPTEVTLTDGSTMIVNEISIAAGDTVEVWKWSDTSGAEIVVLQILDGEGYLDVWHRIDVPTSADDPEPASAGPWNASSLSCFAPMIFSSDQMKYNATAATHVGDTGGLPSAASSGSTATGTLSKIAVKNPGTAAVLLRVTAIQ